MFFQIGIFIKYYTKVPINMALINFSSSINQGAYDKLIFQLKYCLGLWLDDFEFGFFVKIILLGQDFLDLG